MLKEFFASITLSDVVIGAICLLAVGLIVWYSRTYNPKDDDEQL